VHETDFTSKAWRIESDLRPEMKTKSGSCRRNRSTPFNNAHRKLTTELAKLVIRFERLGRRSSRAVVAGNVGLLNRLRARFWEGRSVYIAAIDDCPETYAVDFGGLASIRLSSNCERSPWADRVGRAPLELELDLRPVYHPDWSGLRIG